MNILRFLTPKSDVAYIESDCTVRQGLEKMRYHGYSAIPVIDPDGQYRGTVREGDFLRQILALDCPSLEALEEIPLTDILQKSNPAVKNSASMRELLMRVLDNNFVPVTDDRGCFIGIVRRKEIIEYFTKEYLGDNRE